MYRKVNLQTKNHFPIIEDDSTGVEEEEEDSASTTVPPSSMMVIDQYVVFSPTYQVPGFMFNVHDAGT